MKETSFECIGSREKLCWLKIPVEFPSPPSGVNVLDAVILITFVFRGINDEDEDGVLDLEISTLITEL